MKRALIFGITGQDGSYLAELLLSKGYHVCGVIRRSSSFNTARIDPIFDKLNLVYGDLSDASNISRIIYEQEPDEIYNLAAQSHVKVSFEIPEYTMDIDALGAVRILESIKHLNRPIKYYQASSSEMFGSSPPPQNELTPFHPRSPYGVAKVAAFHTAVNYREAYGLFACNGILFNHESPRRGETFVTRKITRAATRIACGLQDYLSLGNLEAIRDWGHAADYVQAMWLMLQQDKPDDFVIATGESHTVRAFVEGVFGLLDLDWRRHVRIDPRYYRPTEVDYLMGDASKAWRELGWMPTTTLDVLIKEMVDHDLQLAKEEAAIARIRGELNVA